MNQLAPIPYNPTLTRAQLLSLELEGVDGLDLYSDYKRILEEQRPLLKELWDLPICAGVLNGHETALFTYYIETFRNRMIDAGRVLVEELEAKVAAMQS